MPRKSKPTPFARQVVQSLRQAIAMKRGTGKPTLCHRLPVAAPGGGPPATYTVFVTPNADGTFRANCRELVEVVGLGETEEEALAEAQSAIEETLAGPGEPSDLPR